jgi:hypothetical protein
MFIKVQIGQNNATYSIKVSKDEKISAVRTRIAKIVERDPEDIMLKFGLYNLDDDDKKFSDYYGIKEGSTIFG